MKGICMKKYLHERCEECNGELSDCGDMTEDGPSLDCGYCRLNDRYKDLQKDLDKLRQKMIAYEKLAGVAAMCTIDLTSNLESAYSEYMSGELAKGAYSYVLKRHSDIHIALHECGYIAKHPIFDIPCLQSVVDNWNKGLPKEK